MCEALPPHKKNKGSVARRSKQDQGIIRGPMITIDLQAITSMEDQGVIRGSRMTTDMKGGVRKAWGVAGPPPPPKNLLAPPHNGGGGGGGGPPPHKN